MSGPIVRKYGFPNFEKIFGERDLKHGADGELAVTLEEPKTSAEPPKAAPDPGPSKHGDGPDKP